MILNQEQKDILVGSLLGDGSLQTNTKGKTWRYRALHKADHKEYIEYKYRILSNLCGTGLLYQEFVERQRNSITRRFYFNTKVNPCLKFYGDLFYTFNAKTNQFVKGIPITIEKLLTPRALAIFYQDDGALKWKNHGNAFRICTESFSKEDLNRFIKAIQKLYQIEMKLVSHKEGYRIYIPAKSAISFINLIQPYVVPCMLYKVGIKTGDARPGGHLNKINVSAFKGTDFK